VKEMLRQNGKKEKRRIPITVKAFLCESCCPYLPLMGYRTFKVDKGKVWFGVVMEIDSQSETQNCAVSASQLANGSLVYSVAWVDDKRKDRHFTSESQKILETMISLRTAVEGKYFVDAKALMEEKKVSKLIILRSSTFVVNIYNGRECLSPLCML
jgi:hypothetical protein